MESTIRHQIKLEIDVHETQERMPTKTLIEAIRERVELAEHSRPGTQPPIKLRVFANDCGLRNYGYAVVEFEAKRIANGSWVLKATPIEHGINRAVIDNVKDPATLLQQQTEYMRWLAQTVNRSGQTNNYDDLPTVFAAERYMMRRGQGSLTVELVGVMLGTASVLMGRLQRVTDNANIDYTGGVPVILFPSSAWKNSFARRYGSDTLARVYETVNNKWKEGIALTDHQVDAYLQAVYTAHQLLGFSDYAHLARDFIQQLVGTAPADQKLVKPLESPKAKAMKERRASIRARKKLARDKERARLKKAKERARTKAKRTKTKESPDL